MPIFGNRSAILAAALIAITSAARAENPKADDPFSRDNLVAWCIVPFDAKKRGPEERAAMLEKLGIKHFAYDYRAEHVPTWDEELEALKRHGIELTAWWFPTKLNDEAKKTLELFRRHGVKPQLWVSGGGAPTKDAEEQKARVEAEAARIKTIADAAAPLGLKVALYNHGSWYGEPENQIEIIERLKRDGITNVGIVYNLHHGHEHLDRFPELLARMKPHLLALNLNGMTRGGEKIVPLAQGELDLQLLKLIRDSGWRGPVGLLNHTSEDAEARLLDNLDGLNWLLPQLDGTPPAAKPVPRSWRKPSGAPAKATESSKAATGGIVVEGRPEYRALPVTVECRAKLNRATGFNILVASDTKASAEHWELYSFKGSGMFAVYQPGRGGVVQSDVNICDGQWHHLAAILEPERVRLFVDGKLVKDAPTKPLTGKPVQGGLAMGGLVEGGLGCDGEISDVRISKGVREIAEPFARDDRTVDVWHFEVAPNSTAVGAPSAAKTIDRAKLPEFEIIPAAKLEGLTVANDWPPAESYRAWTRSLGGPTSNRYSALDQINNTNVGRLQVAWTYNSGDGKGNIQCNPIIVDGVMFAPTAGHHIVALDAATGRELWRFKPEKKGNRLEDLPARRGLLHWPGEGEVPARVIFTAGNWIYALDPKTGEPLASFGEGGRTEIPTGGTVAGAVWKRVLVVPGFNRDVFGYDVGTGKMLWRFHTIPQPGEFGADTWERTDQGANCWGGMSLDESRGIAYVSTGSPKPNFDGTRHLGQNLFANCVIALNAATGERLWHFQEIRHDIWDLDVPAPPNLVTVLRGDKRVDAVAQVTKIGNTLLLDRVTGAPLFDFRLRRAPESKLPGEMTWPYQPDVEMPEPFARQVFSRDQVTDRTPEAREFIEQLLSRSNIGWFEPFEDSKPTAFYGLHGGAEWTGAAFDPATGRLYVSANELPWMVTIFRDDDAPPAKPPTPGEELYQQACAVCHGPERIGIGVAPPLRGLRHRTNDAEVIALLKTGRNLMPVAPPMTDEQQKQLLDFLFVRDRPQPPIDPKAPPRYSFGGYRKLLDAEEYPGCKPPWGTLNCLDLNTGRLVWKVPLGEYEELTRAGIPKTGTENFGGATVTAGGLVFCAGTRDRKIRAFDSKSGAELWSATLPLHGNGPPATYEAKGRQFVVIPATGGGKLGGPTGDAWVAFALPDKE